MIVPNSLYSMSVEAVLAMHTCMVEQEYIHLHGNFFTWIFDMDATWTFTFLQCVH